MEVTKEQLVDIIKEKLHNLLEIKKIPSSLAPRSSEEFPQLTEEEDLEEAKISKSRMIEIIGKQLDEVVENFLKK